MGIDRDSVQLVIDILGQEGLEKLAQATERLRDRTQSVAEGYRVLDTVVARSVGVVGTYEVATDKVNHELDEMVRQAVEATQAQKALQAALADTGATMTTTTDGVAKLVGNSGKGGQGLLGASYAIQDFVSVLSNGGGLGRALGSVTNNIAPVAAGLGLGAGVAGTAGLAGVAIAALVPVLETLWGKLKGGEGPLKVVTEALDAATVRVKRLQEGVDALHKLAPKGEGEQAKRVDAVLAEGPESQIEAATAQGMAGSPEGAALLGTTRTKDNTSTLAARGDRIKQGLAKATFTADKVYWQGQKIAHDKEVGELFGGRAQLLLADARTNPAALRRLAGLAAANPGGFPAGFADKLSDATPEGALTKTLNEEGREGEKMGREALAQMAKERDAQTKQLNLDGQEGHRLYGEQVARNRKEDDRLTAQLNLQGQEGHDLYNKKVEANARDDERDRAKAAREAKSAAHAKKAADKEAASARIEGQADQLIAHGAGIVGEAFGPEAAAMASNARPEEVHAIKEKTMANLKDGAAPYQALLQAFKEVAEASARNAADTRRFTSQLSGLRGSLQSQTQRFGDSLSFGG